MKKFLMLTMAVALIAFFAMPKGAFAAAQMIFTGDYQVVGVASDNLADRNKDTNDHAAYVMQRFRLTTVAVTENVKGILGFEVGWDEWGKSYALQGAGPLYNQGGDTGVVADTPATNIEVRMAYIEFNVPGMPLTVTAGKQPLMTRQHAILSAAAFSPGLKFDYKIAEGSKLSLWWAKAAEGTASVGPSGTGGLRGNGDADADLYTLEFSQKNPTFEYGVYGVYGPDHRETDVIAASTGTTTTAMAYKDDIYWTGMWAGFKAGPAKLGVDAIYSFGKRTQLNNYKLDYSGYYLRVEGSMNLGGPTLDFMSTYVSGDNNNGDNKIKSFAGQDAYARYPTLGLLYPGPNLLYWGNGIGQEEYAQINLPTAGYSAYDSGYVLGRWHTMLGATMPVDKKLKFLAKYWYLQTAENFPSTITYRGKNMGHEVDFEAHYQLTPNLTVSVEGDYLIAGDYFNPSSTKDADNAWKAAWRIMYMF